MAVKTFITGEKLTTSDTNTYLNNGGLVYIGATTLNAVANNVSNVFSSTYDSYRVVISNFNNGSATTRQVNIRFRTTTDDVSANYFYGETYYFSTTVASAAAAGQTVGRFGNISSGVSNGASLAIDIFNPNLAVATSYSGSMLTYQSDVGFYVSRTVNGGINTTTQYTGFSIIGTFDNLSGTVRVYGYRQA